MIPTSGNEEQLQVALFPIPNVVAFPGVDLPLHVFEPRYRQLVHDCIEADRMIGVCHTIKPIHQPAAQQNARAATPENLEKMLNSNQTTYKPHQVFSAGPCEILETLPDGRLLANVSINIRLELIEELQSLPYRVVSCKAVLDESPPPQTLDNSGVKSLEGELQSKVHQRFIQLVEPENAELAKELATSVWTDMTPAQYSFQIFQCLRFDADVMQHILEARSARERLSSIWSLLQGATDS